MCRYSFNVYKPHFVCFSCRKAFKQATPQDTLKRIGKLQLYDKLQRKSVNTFTEKDKLFLDTVKRDHFNRPIKCPECSQLMADLGLDFKAPAKNAIKKWSIIKGMYVIGHSFHSCGCCGPGFIPKDAIQYREYLLEKLKEYKMQLNSLQNDFSRLSTNNGCKGYWGDKIKLVENEIAKATI